jgi:hypothetical protein
MASALVKLGAKLISAPKDSPWGRRTVFADFDGHRVEFMYSKKSAESTGGTVSEKVFS